MSRVGIAHERADTTKPQFRIDNSVLVFLRVDLMACDTTNIQTSLRWIMCNREYRAAFTKRRRHCIVMSSSLDLNLGEAYLKIQQISLGI